MSDEILKEISKKLDVLIVILIASTMKEETMREKIGMLSSAGLTPAQLAGILKQTPKYISKELSIITKRNS